MSTNNQPVLTPEQMLSSIAGIALKIRKSMNLEDIFNTAVITIRQLLQPDWVQIYRLDPDGSGVVVAESSKQLIGKRTERNSREKWVDRAIGSREEGEVVVQILPEENLWGLLIADRSDRGWQTLEIDLVKHMATMLAIAIQQSQLESQTDPTQMPNNTDNITQEQDKQEKLAESVSLLGTILEATAEGILVISSEGKIVNLNRKCLLMLSLSKYNIAHWDEKELLKCLGQKLKDPQAEIYSFQKSDIIQNRPVYDIMEFKNGKILEIYSLPYNIGEKNIGRVLTFRDLTESKQAEALQQQTLEQLQTVIDAVPGFVSWIGADGRYLGVNKHLAECFELSSGDFVGEELGFLRSSPQFVEFMRQFLASQQLAATQVVEAIIKNSQRYYLIAAQKYQQGNAAVSVGIDITDRQHAGDLLESSLREKEILIKEIHHRVKNNLQVLSSLLDLQGQEISDPQSQEIFRESQNRVKSIALIHENLHRSVNIDKVNFPEYIHNLTYHLRRSYALNPSKITLQLNIEQVSLNINTAIPCGLIINELLSNAFKSAFPGDRTGTVTIAFTAFDDKFQLLVSNDGVKLPETLDGGVNKTLGFKLINALVRQLQGQLEIEASPETTFKIIF